MFDDEVFKVLEPASQETVDKAREIVALPHGGFSFVRLKDRQGYVWVAAVYRLKVPPYGWHIDFVGVSSLFRNRIIPPQTTEEQWVKLLQLFIDAGDFAPFIGADLPDFLK